MLIRTRSSLIFRHLVGLVMFGSLVGFVNADSKEFHRFWPDNLFAIEFVTDNVGYIAGYGGTVLSTRDGGQTWIGNYIGRNELVRRVSFVDEKRGWAVGHRGSIFSTSDGAETWQVQYEKKGVFLRDVHFVDANHGWVVGHDALVLHTNDGGQNWRTQELKGFAGRDAPRLHGISAVDKDEAVLVGEFGVVAHTVDGGNNWWVAEPASDVSLLDVANVGTSGQIGFVAVGLDGTAVIISEASPAERQIIEASRRKVQEAAFKKAKRRAERRGEELDESAQAEVVMQETELYVRRVATGSSEHLLAITSGAHGAAFAVGRGEFFRIRDLEFERLTPEAGLPFDFMWLGGVSTQANGDVWAVGIRGTVIKLSDGTSEFGMDFQLGASDRIRLGSNRWQGEAAL